MIRRPLQFGSGQEREGSGILLRELCRIDIEEPAMAELRQNLLIGGFQLVPLD
jgi:hypothetical protein